MSEDIEVVLCELPYIPARYGYTQVYHGPVHSQVPFTVSTAEQDLELALSCLKARAAALGANICCNPLMSFDLETGKLEIVASAVKCLR